MHMWTGLKNIRVGLFCEDYPTLRDRQVGKIKAEFPRWLGSLKSTQDEGYGFYIKPEYGGGAILLRNLDDPDKYKGAEFAAIGVDQLETQLDDVFDKLRGSLRFPGVLFTAMLATANPGGPGHGWVKAYWIEKAYPKYLRGREEQFYFHKALPQDNPYLDQAYWDELESQPEPLKQAWLFGNWDVYAGQAFMKFQRDTHTCKPFDLPDHWARYRGIDFGTSAPFCCLWGARDPMTGRVYVYREAYSPGLSDIEQGKTIKSMTLAGEKILVSYADPAMFTKQSVRGIITSSADQYNLEGVPLTPGDNGRVSGKRKIDRLIDDLPDGKPGLIVFETCDNLIREISSIQYDRNNVEDVDTKMSDHAYDALRYLLSGIPVKVTTEEAEQQRRKRKENRHSLQNVRIF